MPDELRWRLFSEPYAATGNIGDGGFKRLLGAPSLEGLQVVLREAIQNSCDAAKFGRGPRILIRLRTLTPDQIGFLCERLFHELPFIDESREQIATFLKSATPRVLEICDFDTTGLGGPTRADRIPAGVERTDFIDFLRNVGTQRTTDLGGGTYGFGKASLYMTSRCSTIIVDTLAAEGPGAERRIMACHLGSSGDRSSADGFVRRYTGRHWWGVSRGDPEPTDPATGDLAVAIADALGTPERKAGDTGTSIVILDPDLQEDNPEEAGIRMAEAILWNFWPRLMENTPPEKRIRLAVEIDGQVLDIPAPEICPPLDLFARAMTKIREGSDVESISCAKPRKHLGKLVIEKGLRSERLPMFRGDDSRFLSSAHGIALMRPAELVITTLQGPPMTDARTEWAGVFITSDEREVEQAFAQSEPPAHDTWDPSTLPKGHQKTFVSVALKRLRAAAHEVANPVDGNSSVNGANTPIAAVSRLLGSFLDAGPHGGPSLPGGGGGGGGGKRSLKRRVTAPVFERLELHDGIRTAVFSIEIAGAGPEDHLLVEPAIAMDGHHVPVSRLEGAPPATVLSVRDSCGHELPAGPCVPVGQAEGEYEIRVSVPEDCSIGLVAAMGAGASE